MFNIYSNGTGGHRASYIDTFKKEFKGESKSITNSFFSNKPLFFLMVDDNLFLYAFCSIVRNLFGFKTVGLVFRLKAYVSGLNYKDRIKFKILSFINSNLQKTINVSILPMYVDSKSSLICSEWIYDPQLWDLKIPYEEKSSLNRDIYSLKNDSRVVVASIGSQVYRKGVVEFINLSEEKISSKNDIEFVFAGKMDETCKKHMQLHGSNLCGVDRFISDQEIYFMYSISSHIWCCYHESYDQASGIFGRAVQLGKVVVVRKDSYLHKMCVEESIAYIFPENISNDTVGKFIVDSEEIVKKNSKRKKKSIRTIEKVMLD